MIWPSGGALGAWLRDDANDTLAGVSLFIVAAVLILMAGAMLALAYDEDRRGRAFPRWHPRRWIADDFEGWYGWFMVSDALIYVVLGYGVLASPAGVARWAVLLAIMTGVLAALSFRSWSRAKGVS